MHVVLRFILTAQGFHPSRSPVCVHTITCVHAHLSVCMRLGAPAQSLIGMLYSALCAFAQISRNEDFMLIVEFLTWIFFACGFDMEEFSRWRILSLAFAHPAQISTSCPCQHILSRSAHPAQISISCSDQHILSMSAYPAQISISCADRHASCLDQQIRSRPTHPTQISTSCPDQHILPRSACPVQIGTSCPPIHNAQVTLMI